MSERFGIQARRPIRQAGEAGDFQAEGAGLNRFADGRHPDGIRA